MKRLASVLVVLLAAAGLVALAGVAHFVGHGVSARPEPTPREVRFARAVRHRLIPASARTTPNPLAPSAEIVAFGRAHFADHCASCHGNDGKGQTSYGRRLFPRAPDLTARATQELSDGELFWIVENGVRMTGMPGFGDDDPENDVESWHLVAFIRHLPRLTAEDLAAMERLNPSLSRADVEREHAVEAFLAGDPAKDDEHHH